MKIRLRSIALGSLVLSWLALVSLSGCLYISDAVSRDADDLSKIPNSTVEGARVDMKNYQCAGRQEKDEKEEGRQ